MISLHNAVKCKYTLYINYVVVNSNLYSVIVSILHIGVYSAIVALTEVLIETSCISSKSYPHPNKYSTYACLIPYSATFR